MGLFLKTFAVLIGTIIGAGIFSLPFVAQKSGFFVILIYFLLMTVASTCLLFIYGKICAATEGKHRLPGYVKKYLGERWEKAVFLIITAGITGAILAYLIIGGDFLFSFLSPYLGGSPFVYSIVFWALGAFFIFYGIKSISHTELILFSVFVGIIIVFFIKAVPFLNLSYLRGIDLKHLALPYGVVLFSLWGSAAIPEIKEMFVEAREKRPLAKMKKVIIAAVASSVLIYILFTFVVLGVTGPKTSQGAISGLLNVTGEGVIKLGFVFGVISCFTSFLIMGLTLKKVLWYDLGFSKNFSWFLVCFLPLILFLLGLTHFVKVISFTGAVATGAEAIIIILLYRSFLNKKFSYQIHPSLYILLAVFGVGAVLEVLYFLGILT